MNGYVLHLQGATGYDRVEDVTSFVGEDVSGTFGLLAGHARFMTSLVFGLARFRIGAGPWRFLAAPGALLYFVNDELFLNTRRYLLDDDHTRISGALREVLLAEEEALLETRESLRRMEEEILRRLWEMRRGGEVLP
jgi:F-type H+-transporting ATPase subunit epsilon